jgi:hypothetical protein
MRGVKQAAMTQPEPDDPLKDKYGDMQMVQSTSMCTKAFVKVHELDSSCKGQQVEVTDGECHADQHHIR